MVFHAWPLFCILWESHGNDKNLFLRTLKGCESNSDWVNWNSKGWESLSKVNRQLLSIFFPEDTAVGARSELARLVETWGVQDMWLLYSVSAWVLGCVQLAHDAGMNERRTSFPCDWPLVQRTSNLMEGKVALFCQILKHLEPLYSCMQISSVTAMISIKAGSCVLIPSIECPARGSNLCSNSEKQPKRHAHWESQILFIHK